MKLTTELLNKRHNREEFNCGNQALDDYLKSQAGQDIRKKLSACFVYTEREETIEYVKGYYTLSNAGIPAKLIPADLRKKFPKSYDSIPATLIGRLARDINCKLERVGENLLMDALYKANSASKEIASFAVIVDPIDENAITFYNKYGFQLLPDSGKMFLPMSTIAKLFIKH